LYEWNVTEVTASFVFSVLSSSNTSFIQRAGINSVPSTENPSQSVYQSASYEGQQEIAA